MAWYYSFLALAMWLIACLLDAATFLLSVGITWFRLAWDNWPLSMFSHIADDQILARTWRESKDQATVFVSIDVHAWDIDQSKITDIGMALWHPIASGESDIHCFYWRIKENLSLQYRHMVNESDIFNFGSTGLLNENQVGTIFEDMFSSLARFQRVVLVGHDIRSTLELLNKYWKPPETTTILDTQRVWQIQHRSSQQVALGEALETTSDVLYHNHLLNNAGNDARFTLCLLQAQGSATQIAKS
ncbi:hypothetical protein F4776DRAFT_642458 [Hypoxylon sp. NC0597]|nr:hypothetical protein F4776DRAFT_642458 [Hypoxylon sp. NC0597]